MPRDMMNDPPMDDLPDPHLFVRLEGFARQAEHYGAKDVLRPNAYWWKKLAETLREVAPHVQKAHSTDPLMNAALEQDAAYLRAMGADPGATLEDIGVAPDNPTEQAQPAGETVDLVAARKWATEWLAIDEAEGRQALSGPRNAYRALLAETRRADAAEAELAAIEKVVRHDSLCPLANSEDWPEDETAPRYVAMNEDGDPMIEADTLSEVVRAVDGLWGQCAENNERLTQRVAALEQENARLRSESGMFGRAGET